MVPEGWAYTQLGDLMEFKNGINADKDKYGTGYKFVNVMDVFANDIVTEDNIIGRLQVADKQLQENCLKHGDVLFNRTSETFDEIAMSTIFVGNSTVTFGGFVIRGRPTSDSLSTCFSVHAFQSSYFRAQVIRLGQGAVRANIGQKDLAKASLLLPPIPEQRKIAKVLQTWDRAIATTEKLIDASKQQKKALMQQLLTGKKRFSEFEGEWEPQTVAEFGTVVTGSTPPKFVEDYYGGDISWATAEDLKKKYVGNTKIKLTSSGANVARIVPKGSVLVTCIASIGKNGIAREDLASNQQINAVVINSHNSNEFFYYLIEFHTSKLLAWAGTTAVPILNKSSFEKVKLAAPRKSEQIKIASILANVDGQFEILQAKLNHLKQEKKALMQQLLTGRRRVKVDE